MAESLGHGVQLLSSVVDSREAGVGEDFVPVGFESPCGGGGGLLDLPEDEEEDEDGEDVDKEF